MLLFAPGTIAHFTHGLGVRDVVEIVFGSGRPVRVQFQETRPGRNAQFLVTGFYAKGRAGTVPVRPAEIDDLDQRGAFTIDDSRSRLPSPERLVPQLFIPLTAWPVSGSDQEVFMSYVQRKEKAKETQPQRRRAPPIPDFASDGEAADWYYAHRHDYFAPVKMSAADIRKYFGDVDPESLEDIVQP